MRNGLYNGLDNGLHNGLYDGLNNGLKNGAFDGINNTFDIDALKYINNPNLNNLKINQKYAIDKFVKSLKINGLWDKLYAIYPFLGGTAESCKWNLKDMRDLDAAYRLKFFGGVTFDSIGMKGNGTNSYANTYYNPSTTNGNDFSFGLYLALNIDAAVVDMGTITSGPPTRGYFIQARTSNILYANAGDDNGGVVVTNTDSRGFYIVARNNNINIFRLIKDGTFLANSFGSPAAYSGTNILIGCRDNFGTPAYFNSNKTGFAFLGKALSDNQWAALNTIFQTFKTETGK